MKELPYKFPTISDGINEYYGGRQRCLPTRTLRGYGCGLIAAANILLCLDRRDGVYRGYFGELRGNVIDMEEFNRRVIRMRRLIPILPKIGVNGLSLVLGMALYLRRYRLPYRIKWCFSGKKLWQRIEEMLDKGIPVLFCVGPNFPNFFDKSGVDFYTRDGNGVMHKYSDVKEHYVTATGIDDQWVRISSWGHEYYVNRLEYDRHVKRHSNYVFNNVALIEEKPSSRR